jgi:hypothetical protein
VLTANIAAIAIAWPGIRILVSSMLVLLGAGGSLGRGEAAEGMARLVSILIGSLENNC